MRPSDFGRLGFAAILLLAVAAPTAAQTQKPITAESPVKIVITESQYGSGSGSGLYFGYVFMRFHSQNRPAGFEAGYWYGLTKHLELLGLFSVSHESTGGYGDNLTSALGGLNISIARHSRAKVHVGVLAGLQHNLGQNGLGVEPEATVVFRVNRRVDLYARGGYRIARIHGVTGKGLDVAFGVELPIGRT